MPYIALRVIDVAGGLKRHPGEVVPEAEKWKNPSLWERSGHVRFVAAEEIQDGRWTHYEEYRGASAIPPKTASDARPPAPSDKAQPDAPTPLPPGEGVSDAPARRDEAVNAAHQPGPEHSGALEPQAEAHATGEEHPRRPRRRIRDMMR